MIPWPVLDSHPSNSALAAEDRHIFLGQVLGYVRQRGFAQALPEALKRPTDFMLNGFDGAQGAFDKSEEGEFGFISPVFSLIHPSDEGDLEALWLAPGYHHVRGILPFDDAITYGPTYRKPFLDQRLKISLHPFYGQNWHSSDGYWGIDGTLSIGPEAQTSWGTIGLRYNNGSSNLMEHGRGLDLHADLTFDEHLSLSAGARQNDQSDVGNYALLRWHISLGP